MRFIRFGGVLTAVLGLAVGAACGPVEESLAGPDGEVGTVEQDLASTNGLSFNGLSFNGLSFNGLSFNGLSFNGLSSAEFQAWFRSNPAASALVMKYVVRCAVPAGQTRSYRDPYSGVTYTWEGLLGLAPDWASGRVATTAEQQVVSACLAAHANKRGISMAISVLGRNARGETIPYTWAELAAFPEREACFFGNLFTGEGIYVATDQGLLRGGKSSPRECALSPGPLQSVDDNCPPLVPLGSCDQFCDLDLLRPYRTRCTYKGIDYRPITTRMRSEDIYVCGDGTCQRTEACGVGVNYRHCLLDCGLCW